MKFLVNPPQSIFNQLIDKSAKTDGWAHQPYDYEFWKTNFDGFWFFAFVNEQNEEDFIAGACLAKWTDKNNKNDDLFSIGLYYCLEEYRGLGLGTKIFKAMMEIVGESNACLTGAVSMISKYSKNYGFDKISPMFYLHSAIELSNLSIPLDISTEISTKNWKNVDKIEWNAYDSTICPRNREKIMQNWFEMDQVYTRVAFDKSGKIVGYAAIRSINLNRLCACPFYSDNLKTAERLLADVLAEIPDLKNYSEIIFWHPENNYDAKKLFSRFSTEFTSHLDFKTQFTKKYIESADEKVFSVADSTHQFV